MSIKEKSVSLAQTPHTGVELRKLLDGCKGPESRQLRAIFRKAGKALDKKNVELAITCIEKRALERRIDDLKPKKKAKVVPDPNRRFVQIEHVQTARGIAHFQNTHKPRSGAMPMLDLNGTCLNL